MRGRDKILLCVVINLLLSSIAFAGLQNKQENLFFERTKKHDSTSLNLLIDKAFEYAFYNPDSAFYFVDKALKHSAEVSYNKGIADGFQTKGIIYYATDNYDSAIAFFNKAVIYRRELQDFKGVASSYNNIALAYHNLAKYEEAIEYSINALTIREGLNDSTGIAKSMNNLGMSYHYLYEYETALKYYKDALRLKYAFKDKKDIASTLNNIGSLFFDWAQGGENRYTDSSAYYLSRSLEIHKEIDDIQGASEALLNLANLYIKSGHYHKALNYLNKAIESFNVTGDKYGLALVHFNKGYIYSEQMATDMAQVEFLKSIKIAKDIGNQELLIENYQNISNLYKKMGEYKSALDYYENYTVLMDSVISLETKREVAKLQSQYETEKKENLILKQKSNIESLQLKVSKFIIIVNIVITLIVIVIIYLVRKHLKKTRKLLNVVEEKNTEITRKNEIILDSIKYAKTVQKEIIPSQASFLNSFDEAFVIDKPKDIIGGDFLWYHEIRNQKIVAVIDCIGHGVPGSIMTIAADFLLNKIIIEDKISSPELIIKRLEVEFFQYFETAENQKRSLNTMDIAVCCVDDKKVEYSGARRPLVRISKGKVDTYQGITYPIGRIMSINNKEVIKHSFDIEEGDCYYLFTDGFVDQFGGEDCKQLGVNDFLTYLHSVHILPMDRQKRKLSEFVDNWRKGYEQIDDMFMLGFKF